MGIIKWITLILTLFVTMPMVSFGNQFGTPGKVEIQGEIIAGGCSFIIKNSEQYIEFGEVTARDITLRTSSRLRREFGFTLVGCAINNHKTFPFSSVASVVLSSEETARNSRFFSVKGEAKGFGISIETDNGKIMEPGREITDSAIVDGKNTINFVATLVPLSTRVTSGSFYADVRFYFDYL